MEDIVEIDHLPVPSDFDQLQHPKQRIFLRTLSTCGNVTSSAVAAGIDRTTVYQWAKDKDFAKLMDTAKAMATDYLEAEAWRRATQGTDKGIYYRGKKIDIEKQYSDTLLIFLLKGALPGKYRERGALDITVGTRYEDQLTALLEDDND